jgi:hypothetical protein
MTELRRSIYLLSTVALLAIAALLTGYLWRESKPQSWPFPPERSELVAKIKEIQDIEHLRKVSLLLVKGSNDVATDANKVVDNAIRLVFVLLGSIALIAALSALSLMKHFRKTQGRPVGWLRWL